MTERLALTTYLISYGTLKHLSLLTTPEPLVPSNVRYYEVMMFSKYEMIDNVYEKQVSVKINKHNAPVI